jgi:hypothetical protein
MRPFDKFDFENPAQANCKNPFKKENVCVLTNPAQCFALYKSDLLMMSME